MLQLRNVQMRNQEREYGSKICPQNFLEITSVVKSMQPVPSGEMPVQSRPPEGGHIAALFVIEECPAIRVRVNTSQPELTSWVKAVCLRMYG